MTAKASGLLPSRARARQTATQNMRRAMARYSLGGGVLTASNVITDAARTAALAWGTGQQGGQTDGQTPPAGIYIGRAATNLFRRGQCDSVVVDSWLTTANCTQSVDPSVPAPFSPQSVKYVTAGVAAQEGSVTETNTGQAAAAGTTGVGSIYVRGVSGQSYSCFFQWINTDASTTNGTSLTFTATGAWQQVTPPALAVAVGKTGDKLRMRLVTFTQRAESFWVAHPMLESGQNVASPYVATSGGATASSSLGVLNFPSSLLNTTQCWLAMAVTMGFPSTGAGNPLPRTFDCTNNGINWLRGIITPGTPGTFSFDRANDSVGAPAQALGSWAAGDTVLFIGACDATTVSASLAGGAFGTAANTNIPAASAINAQVSIGNNSAGGNRTIDSRVRWLAVGYGRPNSADPARLAAFGGTPPKPWQLPRHLLTAAVMPMVTTAYDLS